jgi:hypothetical protein
LHSWPKYFKAYLFHFCFHFEPFYIVDEQNFWQLHILSMSNYSRFNYLLNWTSKITFSSNIWNFFCLKTPNYNVIKLFIAIYRSKLECLPLTFISTLDLNLQAEMEPIQVLPFTLLHSRSSHIILPANIRLGLLVTSRG